MRKDSVGNVFVNLKTLDRKVISNPNQDITKKNTISNKENLG